MTKARDKKKSTDFPLENFCDFLRKNSKRLTPNLTKEEFTTIFKELLLENFGDIQPKSIILSKTVIYPWVLKEIIDNKKISEYFIGAHPMYNISDVGDIICGTYYTRYLNKKYQKR